MTISTNNKKVAGKRSSRQVKSRKPTSLRDFYDDDDVEQKRRRFHVAEDTMNQRRRGEFEALLPEGEARGTWIPQYLLKITKNSTHALLLAQLIYWLDEKRSHAPQPYKGLYYRWTAQTSDGLASQLSLSVDQVDKALTALRKSRFVDWKIKMFNGTRHRHFWVNWCEIGDAYDKVKGSDRHEEE